MSHLLSVERLRVHYTVPEGLLKKGIVQAVRSVDFRLDDAQTLGIVGESGCGKSTIARVLVGLEQITDGSVTLCGQDIAKLRGSKRTEFIAKNVSMIFQDPSSSVNPRLNARNIIRDPLDVMGIGTAANRDDRVEEIMALVGLPGSLAERLPRQMSGGQRQRLAIARSLVIRPKLIIADEPTSALDVSVRAQIINLLMQLKAKLSLSMVLISHDIHSVRYLSDRIAVMYLGEFVEEGTVAQVSDRPRHPYTMALLSSAPSFLRKGKEKTILAGGVPSPRNPPAGCAFSTRCWRTVSGCTQTSPETDSDNGQFYRCFNPLTGANASPGQ